jgi:ribonuclease Z
MKFPITQKNLCFNASGMITFESLAQFYSDMCKLSSLFHPLTTIMNDSIIPPHFVDGRSFLQYHFAPFDKIGFTYPPTEEFADVEVAALPAVESFTITFLSTGEMFPSKYRSVSGILIHTKDSFVVLDCGEGFSLQLKRLFGEAQFKFILERIILIWISHDHGDHFFGLYELLQERAMITTKIVLLYCHHDISDHLQNLSHGLFFEAFVHHVSHNMLETNRVNHCPYSFGCVLTIDKKWRIAYTGDRGGNDLFAETVKYCDVMIHEATFSDDMAENAALY